MKSVGHLPPSLSPAPPPPPPPPPPPRSGAGAARGAGWARQRTCPGYFPPNFWGRRGRRPRWWPWPSSVAARSPPMTPATLRACVRAFVRVCVWVCGVWLWVGVGVGGCGCGCVIYIPRHIQRERGVRMYTTSLCIFINIPPRQPPDTHRAGRRWSPAAVSFSPQQAPVPPPPPARLYDSS